MNALFRSATLKLTAWYIAILAVICIMFSVIVYQISVGEVSRRLESYSEQTQTLFHTPLNSFIRIQTRELNEAKASLIIVLLYTNLVIIAIGGVGSYFLARRTLQPVEESHSQQARFVSDASHELRTPLAAMTTELEVALRDASITKQEQHELLQSNLEEVQRLTKLTTTLLWLSAGDAQALQFSSFNIVESSALVAKRLESKHHPITVQSSKKALYAVGHKESIEELCAILLDNAVQYGKKDSPIIIDIREVHGRVEVRITNAGKGIAPEHIPHVFDRFFRADTARSGKGYGLGLALALKISLFHKAGLSVESTPDVSTTFSFSLGSDARTQK
jgi:signal transduction histidine kinase